MAEQEINQGYVIIEKYRIGNVGFAIGNNINAPEPYVTWQFRQETPHEYFWGHYYKEKQNAYADYRKRLAEKITELEEKTKNPFPMPLDAVAVHQITGDLVYIRLGEHGFSKSELNTPGDVEANKETAAKINTNWGVTKVQEEAMLMGAMVGWDIQEVNPQYETEAEALIAYCRTGDIKLLYSDEKSPEGKACLGHLRGDFGSGGHEFYTTWWEHHGDLKTPDFMEDFDHTINSLRENGFLKDFSSMSRYCYTHPGAKISAEQPVYGFRIKGKNHDYYLRLTVRPGDYNIYCYCYQRDLLEKARGTRPDRAKKMSVKKRHEPER